MTIPRLTSLWHRFCRWRSIRRLYAAYPEIRAIDRAKSEARRKHKPTKHLDAEKAAFVTVMLRENLPSQRR